MEKRENLKFLFDREDEIPELLTFEEEDEALKSKTLPLDNPRTSEMDFWLWWEDGEYQEIA